jgi:hypothetical protein
VNKATPATAFAHLKASSTSSRSRTIKKESILAHEGIVCIEAIDQSGQHRSGQPFKHSPLPQQFEAAHVTIDIEILQRMHIVLFHPCDLIDQTAGFIHIDDQTKATTVINRIPG